MRKVKIFLLLIINAVFCFAKNTDSLINVIPPSPTVSALCKYAQYPVDYSTGVTNISIPIYTIQCGSLELPISLTYHAGGIKVDDMASWVGLGWSLNYGGCIGRTVYGRADSETSFPYYMPKYEDAESFNISQFDKYVNGRENKKRNIMTLLDALDYAVKHCDGQPDLYSYNFCGNTGQFMYDYSEKRFYDIRDNKSLKFKSLGLDGGFNVYDSNGNLYVFNLKEFLSSSTNPNYDNFYPAKYHVSAWNISKMKSFNLSDSIFFEYNDNVRETDNYQSATSLVYGTNGEEKWVKNYYPVSLISTSPSDVYRDMAFMVGSPGTMIINNNAYITKKISRIKCSNGLEILFVMDIDRKDTNCGAKLNEIVIKNADGKLIKRVALEYEYFKSYISCEYDSHLDYRLKLKSVKEYGSDNTLGDVYSLDYYGESSGEPQMPYRHSYCGRDKWGYCNALVNSADAKNYKKAFPNVENIHFTMYKQLYGNLKYNRDVYASYTEGSDMTASQDYAVAYMLKRMKYSTGASIEFKYELNHYSCPESFNCEPYSREMTDGVCEEYGAGLRIKEIIKSDGGNTYVTSYTYSEGEIVEVPHFVSRRHYESTYCDVGINASSFWENIMHGYESDVNKLKEQEYYIKNVYNGDCQTYLEIFPHPYNIERLGNGGIGYTRVVEKTNDITTEYVFSSVRNEQTGIDEDIYGFSSYKTFHSISPFCSNQGVNTGWDIFAFLGYPEYLSRLQDYGETQILEDDRYDMYPGLHGTYFSRGLLLSKSVSKKGGGSESWHYEYRNKNVHRIPGMIVEKMPRLIAGAGFEIISPSITLTNAYKASLYYHIAGRAELVKTIHRKNGVSTTTSYTYNSNNQVVSTTTTDSYNRDVVNTTTYASDLNDSVSIAMQKKNMLDYPVECTELVNGKVVSANLTTYKRNGGTYYPYAVYKYSPNKPDSTFVPYSGNVQKCYGNPLINYTSYCNGRLCEAVKPSGLKYTYLWSYKWEYPVAEIMSNTAFSVGNYINNESLGSKTFVNESMFADLINACKNNNWQIVRYTYKPFIGIETITPLSGATLKYCYDGLGRLTGTYENGNLTESYDYHIKK